MMKKGFSQILSWVMIIGFTIALGVFVFKWAYDFASESTDTTIKEVESDLHCDKVSILVYPEDDCGLNDNLIIKNRGYITINKIIIRKTSEGHEVVPFFKIDSVSGGCKEKRALLKDCSLVAPFDNYELEFEIAPNDFICLKRDGDTLIEC